MRVGLIGFGRTGRAVARTILRDPCCTLEWVVRRSLETPRHPLADALDRSDRDESRVISSQERSADELLARHPVDAIIDFSSPEGLAYYGAAAADLDIPIVTAVSAYPCEQRRRLQELAGTTPVLWSPNITLGVNMVILAATLLQRVAPLADIEVIEEHFALKKGVSSTARVIADALGVADTEIKSLRAGGIIGTHEVVFGLPSQTVRLRHESVSREAFGEGALFAARHLQGLDPGLYSMEDLLIPEFIDNARRLRYRPRALVE